MKARNVNGHQRDAKYLAVSNAFYGLNDELNRADRWAVVAVIVALTLYALVGD